MKLDSRQGDKPLDFGFGGVSGSLNQDGRFVAINTYHPAHGYVTLTGMPPFADSDRYQPDAVRRYRQSLVEQGGFGLRLGREIVEREAELVHDLYPLLRLYLDNGSEVECLTYPVAGCAALQRWRFSDPVCPVQFTGQIWLQRCAYTQLTEGGPIMFPSVETTVVARQHTFITLYNAPLGWAACVSQSAAILGRRGSVILDSASQAAGAVLVYAVGFGRDAQSAQAALLQALAAPPADEAAAQWHEIPKDPILRRGLAYSLVCSTPVSDDSMCILTDHMILPLSWNRDAYYASKALLHWHADYWPLVRQHLIWLFESAARPDGLWGRSYLANGQVKDLSFQLDQQLYPLIELFEYLKVTGDSALLERLGPQIPLLVQALRPYAHSSEGLYRTEETPADDPVALPYHLSSHILLWYVCTLMEAADFTANTWPQPEMLRQAVYRYFVASSPDSDEAIFAYATDTAGQHHFYHDANDFPLVLAPLWGFCATTDPIWQATLRFAFSSANEGGSYQGRLGSVHTASAWPLGDIQELLLAKILDDAARFQQVLARIQQVAQWDGALAEAVDVVTGKVVSRHWFLWPNAAYACVMMGAFEG